jgi:DnaJ-domain-containing protein 1
MSDSPADALEEAIALYRAPTRLSRLQGRPLGNALLLLRIAANDRAAIAAAAQATGESAETVTDAALLYIQQVLFADTADAYRLLGARQEDATAQIQEHYRWLMRWLHPDRQPERWEVVYSDRINRAWQTLRSPERRAAYDLSLHSHPTAGVRERQLPMRHRAAAETGKPLLSSRTKRRLPQFVLGGLGVGALIVLGLLYESQEEMPTSTHVSKEVSASVPPMQPVSDSPTASAASQNAEARPGATLPSPGAEASLTTVQSNPIAPPAIPTPPTGSEAVQSSMVAAAARNEHAHAEPVLAAPIAISASRPGSIPVPQGEVHQPPIRSQRLVAAIATSASATPASNARRPDLVAATAASGAGSAEKRKSSPAAVSSDSHVPAAVAVAAESTLPPPSKPATQPAVRPTQETANALAGSFTRAYAAGDLSAMMGLFSADAVNNRGGVDAIATDYDKLFRETQSRELRLERLAWTTSDDRIVGSGPFQANIQRRGDSTAQRVDGWITIEARLIDGHWRIQRIIHRNAQ